MCTLLQDIGACYKTIQVAVVVQNVTAELMAEMPKDAFQACVLAAKEFDLHTEQAEAGLTSCLVRLCGPEHGKKADVWDNSLVRKSRCNVGPMSQAFSTQALRGGFLAQHPRP